MTIAHTPSGICTGLLALALVLGAAGRAQAQSQTMPQHPGPTTLSGDYDPDEQLENDVRFALETHDVLRRYDVDVDVDDRVVTLSGEVATDEQREQAIAVAAAFDETFRVEDDIEVDPDEDRTLAERIERGLSKAGEEITEAWITARINWFLMSDSRLDGSNVDVDTEGRAVTLRGTVPSDAARTRAIELARMTDGVDRVQAELAVAPARE